VYGSILLDSCSNNGTVSSTNQGCSKKEESNKTYVLDLDSVQICTKASGLDKSGVIFENKGEILPAVFVQRNFQVLSRWLIHSRASSSCASGKRFEWRYTEDKMGSGLYCGCRWLAVPGRGHCHEQQQLQASVWRADVWLGGWWNFATSKHAGALTSSVN